VHRYENGIFNLNTYAVREHLGKNFSIDTKQDAFDFLVAFYIKYDFIKKLVEYQIISTCPCITCGNTKVTINNFILSIFVNNSNKKSFNLNDLLNTSFSYWIKLNDKLLLCECCEGNDTLFKNEITLIKQIIIIHLISFSK